MKEKTKTIIITVFLAFGVWVMGAFSGMLLCEMEKEETTTYPEFELTDFEVKDMFYNLDPGDDISVYYKVQDNWLLGCVHLENNNKTGDGGFPISTAEYCKKIKEIR